MVLFSSLSEQTDSASRYSQFVGRSRGQHLLPRSLPESSLFGTDGIRGRFGDLLSGPLAAQIGYWAGIILKEIHLPDAPIIVGQDSRNSSPVLASALACGLNAAGLDVWDIGLCPTPAIAHLAHRYSSAGGVMISASHNPPEDNGIKFFDSAGRKLSPSLQKAIEAALRGGRQPEPIFQGGQYYYLPGLLDAYAVSLHQSLPENTDLGGMRIVLDLAWGSATSLGASIFEELGAEVICLHNRPNGDRINVNCGSTHLTPLQAAVVEHQADLGFAFDGDADRVMAVDNQGRPVNGDYILYLWGKTLREQKQLPHNLIVSTVMANLGFERAWQKLGGRLLRTAVGDQHVYTEMSAKGAMLGGEQSGHILCPHYGISGDGMLTALHLAAIIKQAGISSSELVDQSFYSYPQILRNVRVEDCDRRRHWQQSELLQRAIAKAGQDMGDRGRVLVRPSGTEPLIRIMVEAADASLVHYWTTELVKVVRAYASA
jgi:phosphoglucosamine mutase